MAYSDQLYQYLGKILAEAEQEEEDFRRYSHYEDALRQIPDKLASEERGLARRVLSRRMRESLPSNIGCASGDSDAE